MFLNLNFRRNIIQYLFIPVLIIISGAVFISLGLIARIYFNQKKIDPLVASYTPPEASTPPKILHFIPKPKKIIPGLKIKVPILMYHYVEVNKDIKDTIRTSLSVIPYNFDQQLATLKKAGYVTITMNDLYSAISEGVKLPDKPVILTFDDGYRDFYTDAFPILKKYHAKATQYVIVNHLGRSGNLTDDMVKELILSGLITIGAHTLNHASLVSVNKTTAEKEINDSKSELEKKFGIKIYDFAYPYGFLNQDVVEMVKKAGYKTAVATTLGEYHSLDNILQLSRIRVGNIYGKALLDRIEKLTK